MSSILISINPEYVEKIFDGSKKYEYRKVKCKKTVDKMVIYCTSPVMKVVGEAVIEEILRNLPCEPPETGGILGGSNGTVMCSALDCGKTGGSPCSYTPDIAFLNRKIEEWFKDGIEFMGIFHVHFGGAESLSTGDKLYISRILKAMPERITCLYFPVVKMPEREMVVYRASNDHGKIRIEREPILYQGGIYDGKS